MDSNRMHTFLDIQRERDQNRGNPLGLASWFQLTAPIIGGPSPATSSSSPYSQARTNLVATQLRDLLVSLDPARSVALVNTSSASPSHLASTLAAHAPDLVVSTLGAAHPSAQDAAAAQQVALIDACVAAGVSRLLLVPLRAECDDAADAEGADGRGWDGVTADQAQARVLRHLRAVADGGMGTEAGAGGAVEQAQEQAQEQEQAAATKSNMKLEWIGIACGTTLDTALLNGALGVDMEWASAEVVGSGTSEFGASSAAWVARVAAAAVQHWERMARRSPRNTNRVLHVAGCVTSPAAVLRCLEAATSRAYLVSFVTVDEAVREARKRVDRGFVDRGAEMLERAFLLGGRSTAAGAAGAAVAAFKEDRSALGLLGLEPESVRDIVGVAVHRFRQRDTAGCGCGCG